VLELPRNFARLSLGDTFRPVHSVFLRSGHGPCGRALVSIPTKGKGIFCMATYATQGTTRWDRDRALGSLNRIIQPALTTEWGALFEGDCLDILPSVSTSSVDLVFADPPFNLGKNYGEKTNDSKSDEDYIAWCKNWIDECIRILQPGGAFFLYNLPKWNMVLGSYLTEAGLEFRHWITVNIKMRLPIRGRLYPAHYSLLYFTKGKPKTFHNIRTPIETCRHCGGEIKDYGGHRQAMNPLRVNLSDVWSDVPPVRHWKFKSKKRKANQLSTKIVWRAIHLATEPGDLVIDPFGGSGTTFDVCEQNKRFWLGIELNDADIIIERLTSDSLSHHEVTDFVE